MSLTKTCYELIDPKQGYNKAKIQKPHLNSVCKKANVKIFVKTGNMSIISPKIVQNLKIEVG